LGYPPEAIYHTLGVEEPSHPETSRPSFKNPLKQLSISFYEFCKPEPDGRRFPGELTPLGWNFGIKKVVQRIAKILKSEENANRSDIRDIFNRLSHGKIGAFKRRKN